MGSISDTAHSSRVLKEERRAYAVGVAIVLAAALVAGGLYKRGIGRGREAFRGRASAIAVAVRERVSAPIEAVRNVPPYFAASGLVEPGEFRVFVEPMLATHPAITRVAFAPLVRGDERGDVEARAQEGGFPAFAIRERYADQTLGPSRPRESYLPILFCEPRCDDARGLDLGAAPPTVPSVARASLTSRSVAVAPSGWLDGRVTTPGRVTVFAPLTSRPATSADLRVPRPGVAAVEVDVGRAIATAVARLDSNTTRLDLVDVTDPAHEVRLYRSSRDRGAAAVGATYVERFRVHGHLFAMRFVASRAAIDVGLSPAIAAAAGVLLAVVTTLALVFAARARRLSAEVEASKQLGPYRLIRRVGQGGMGTVYEAEHALLRRPTAVKVISDSQASGDVLERFEREAKLTSQLTHPNTIVVFDFGRTESGVFYYAMEFLRGLTLDDIVRTSGPQPPARVVHILRQIASSLAEAHATGFVHRDMKPSNVMVCTRGGAHDFVKVLDFGLVKDVFGEEATTLSMSGFLIGTPRYMAPEVFVDAEKPTPAADVYAVGAIALYLLTGRELIEGTSMSAIVAHHANGVVVPPSEQLGPSSMVPPELDALVVRCLARHPEARPQTGEELRRALDALEMPAWTEADACRAQIGYDERYPEASGDITADDTLAIDGHSRERSSRSARDGDRAA